jgi:hypothetical protein
MRRRKQPVRLARTLEEVPVLEVNIHELSLMYFLRDEAHQLRSPARMSGCPCLDCAFFRYSKGLSTCDGRGDVGASRILNLRADADVMKIRYGRLHLLDAPLRSFPDERGHGSMSIEYIALATVSR